MCTRTTSPQWGGWGVTAKVRSRQPGRRSWWRGPAGAAGVSWWTRERRPCRTDAGIRGHGDEFGAVGRSVQAAAGGPPVICGGIMAILDVVGLYYDAWANKEGDLSGVPLA